MNFKNWNFKLFTTLAITASISFGAPIVSLKKVADGYLLNYTAPQKEIISVDSLGIPTNRSGEGTFSTLEIEGYSTTEEVGMPSLPVYSFSIAVSDTAETAKLSFDEIQETSIPLPTTAFPTQEPWAKSTPTKERVFSINNEFYSSSRVPSLAPLAKITETFNVRGIQGITIAINPFRYNPATKTITSVDKFTLKIKTSHQRGLYKGVESKAVEQYLKSFFINFEDAVEQVAPAAAKDLYLIITAPAYEQAIADFATFRKRRFDVKTVTTQTTGTTSTSIQDYIRNHSPKPLYVLLVGDVNAIPSRVGSGTPTPPQTDLYYGTSATSYIPEIFVGRFSVNSTTQLANMVRKTIFMEENLAKLPKNTVLIAGYDKSEGHIGVRTHTNSINTYFTPNGYTNKFINAQATPTSLKSEYLSAFNPGTLINMYSAHGSPTSWAVRSGSWSVTTTDAAATTNATSFPVTYAFACLTGSYHQECMSESWSRAQNGAVTSVGSTVNSYWGPDEELQMGVIKSWFASSPIATIGASLAAAKAKVSGSMRRMYYEMYNIMGDPAYSVFPVITGPSISISSPQESDTLYVGEKTEITWDSQGEIGEISIDVTTDSLSFSSIIAKTANTGKFSWTIPEIISNKVRIRIKNSAGTVTAFSKPFTIIGKPSISLSTKGIETTITTGSSTTLNLVITNTGKGGLVGSLNQLSLSDNLTAYAKWQASCDALGSTIDTGNGLITGSDATLSYKIAAADNEKNIWPWAVMSASIDTTFKGLTHIKVRYKATHSFSVLLDQTPLSDSGESYQALLPASGTAIKDTTILLSAFKQPEWVEAGKTTPLNLSLVKSTSFSIASNAVEGKLTIFSATPGGIVTPERKTPVKLNKKVFEATGSGKTDEIGITITAPDNFSGILTDTLFIYHNAPETPSPIMVPVKVSVSPVSINGKSQRPSIPSFKAIPTIATKQDDNGISFHLQLPDEGKVTVSVFDNLGNSMWKETVESVLNETVIGPWPLTTISGRFAAPGSYLAIADFTDRTGKKMSSQIMVGIRY